MVGLVGRTIVFDPVLTDLNVISIDAGVDHYLVKSTQALVSRDVSVAGLPGAENTNEQGTDGSNPALLITF